MIDGGVQKSAILMLALGEDEAVEVMKHLAPREVQKLGHAMAGMKAVAYNDVEEVLAEFLIEAERVPSFGLDADNYIRNVLTKALGGDEASTLLNRILQGSETSGIDALKWLEPHMVAELIGHEHPQIIATILVHLDRDHACEILNHCDDGLRKDVVLRIATLDGVQPSALRELNETLGKLLTGNENIKKKPMGGIRTAAEILNFMSGANEASVFEGLRSHDEDLAQKVMDAMFVFENIMEIDDRGIQLLLREVQSDALIVALKGAGTDLREKIFKNMSQRAAEMMREDLESKGPVRLSEVEAQQKEILQIVRRLADEGQIALGSKGEDAFV